MDKCPKQKNCSAGIQSKNENPTAISKSCPTIFLETHNIFSGIEAFLLENFTRRRIDFLMVVVNIYIIVVHNVWDPDLELKECFQKIEKVFPTRTALCLIGTAVIFVRGRYW